MLNKSFSRLGRCGVELKTVTHRETLILRFTSKFQSLRPKSKPEDLGNTLGDLTLRTGQLDLSTCEDHSILPNFFRNFDGKQAWLTVGQRGHVILNP